MERSTATFDEIVRVSGIEKSLTRECLVASIQHNFVVAVEEEKESSKPGATSTIVTNYRIIMENVLVRLRFSKYVSLARDKFGESGEQIVLAFVKDGRGTVRSLLQASVDATDPQYSRQDELDAIKQLMDNKFIMKIPEANTNTTLPCRSNSAPVASGDEDEDAPATRGRKRSASGTVIAKRAGVSDNKDPSKAKKSAKPTSASSAAGRPKKSSANAKKTTNLNVAPEMKIYGDPSEDSLSPMMIMAEQQQQEHKPIKSIVPTPASSSAAPSTMQLESDDAHYCLDYDRFNKEFAKEACIAFVGEKIDALAAGVVREMFEISETSQWVSEDRLYFNLTNTENPRFNRALSSIPKERLKQYLDLMSKDKTHMLIRQTSGFAINHKSILDTVKQKLMESVVLDKFGSDSLRIFRLLMMKHLLEQKQVSELAMTPIKETRDCLYKMLQSNYVHLQEVPRTSEHNPSKTFYLWSVRLHHVKNILLNDMYKALRNMKLRLSHTLQLHADLIAKRDEEERIQQDTPKYSRLTDADHATLAELTNIQDRLDVSMLHIDSSIMTLEDF
jgi:transcription initiation factor IIE alpha subunit